MNSVVIALLLAGGVLAAPIDNAQRLELGKRLVAELEYERAATELMLVANSSTASDEQRAQAFLHAGMAYVVLERTTEARLAFLYVLRRDQAATLPPETSPKIMSFFELCRDEAESLRPASAPASQQETSGALVDAVDEADWTPFAVSGAGAALLVGSLVLTAVGSVPWLQHQAAADELRALEQAGDSSGAVQLQEDQQAAGQAWTTWGMPLTVGGLCAATAGVLIAGAGIAWMGLQE